MSAVDVVATLGAFLVIVVGVAMLHLFKDVEVGALILFSFPLFFYERLFLFKFSGLADARIISHRHVRLQTRKCKIKMIGVLE